MDTNTNLFRIITLIQNRRTISTVDLDWVAGYSIHLHALLLAYMDRFTSQPDVAFDSFRENLVRRLKREIEEPAEDSCTELVPENKLGDYQTATPSKRVVANRRNARQSTGPRTDHGKHHSARNAFKHGLRSEQLMLTDSQLPEYRQVVNTVHARIAPRDELEKQLLQNISVLLWKLMSCSLAEIGLARDSRFRGVRLPVLRYSASLMNKFIGAISKLSQYGISEYGKELPMADWDLLTDGVLTTRFLPLLPEPQKEAINKYIQFRQRHYDRTDWTMLLKLDALVASEIKCILGNNAEAAHMQISANNGEERVRKADPSLQAAMQAISIFPPADVLEQGMRYEAHQRRQIGNLENRLKPRPDSGEQSIAAGQRSNKRVKSNDGNDEEECA